VVAPGRGDPGADRECAVTWDLRHALTESLIETMMAHTPQDEYPPQQSHYPQYDRLFMAHASVPCTVETMERLMPLKRPYFYSRPYHCGVYLLYKVLGLMVRRIQLDVQQKADIVDLTPALSAALVCP
jgi:hypothetical protein